MCIRDRLCFRQQLLRTLDCFCFVRVRSRSDLSSFACVWHGLIVCVCGGSVCAVVTTREQLLVWRRRTRPLSVPVSATHDSRRGYSGGRRWSGFRALTMATTMAVT